MVFIINDNKPLHKLLFADYFTPKHRLPTFLQVILTGAPDKTQINPALLKISTGYYQPF
jgi:hypothetical protein